MKPKLFSNSLKTFSFHLTKSVFYSSHGLILYISLLKLKYCQSSGDRYANMDKNPSQQTCGQTPTDSQQSLCTCTDEIQYNINGREVMEFN